MGRRANSGERLLSLTEAISAIMHLMHALDYDGIRDK